MSDLFYIMLAYGLTYVVLGGYALRLRSQRQSVLAEERKGRGRAL
jgi:heme exporter protein D